MRSNGDWRADTSARSCTYGGQHFQYFIQPFVTVLFLLLDFSSVIIHFKFLLHCNRATCSCGSFTTQTHNNVFAQQIVTPPNDIISCFFVLFILVRCWCCCCRSRLFFIFTFSHFLRRSLVHQSTIEHLLSSRLS